MVKPLKALVASKGQGKGEGQGQAAQAAAQGGTAPDVQAAVSKSSAPPPPAQGQSWQPSFIQPAAGPPPVVDFAPQGQKSREDAEVEAALAAIKAARGDPLETAKKALEEVNGSVGGKGQGKTFTAEEEYLYQLQQTITAEEQQPDAASAAAGGGEEHWADEQQLEIMKQLEKQAVEIAETERLKQGLEKKMQEQAAELAAADAFFEQQQEQEQKIQIAMETLEEEPEAEMSGHQQAMKQMMEQQAAICAMMQAGGDAGQLQESLMSMVGSRNFDNPEQAIEWQNNVIAVFTQMQTQQQYETLSEENKQITIADDKAVDQQLEKIYQGTDPQRTAIGQRQMSFHEKEKNNHLIVFIGGLRTVTSEERLATYFRKFGNPTFVEVKRLPDRTSRGFGFVHFETSEAVQKVIAAKDQHVIDGKWIDVRKCEAQEKKNSNKNKQQTTSFNPRAGGKGGGKGSGSSSSGYGASTLAAQTSYERRAEGGGAPYSHSQNQDWGHDGGHQSW